MDGTKSYTGLVNPGGPTTRPGYDCQSGELDNTFLESLFSFGHIVMHAPHYYRDKKRCNESPLFCYRPGQSGFFVRVVVRHVSHSTQSVHQVKMVHQNGLATPQSFRYLNEAICT